MMMFFFSNDHGFDRHIFAAGRDRAAELFLAHQVLNGVRPGDFWCERLLSENMQEPDRTHLRRAPDLCLEGMATYDEAGGWSVVLPHREETTAE